MVKISNIFLLCYMYVYKIEKKIVVVESTLRKMVQSASKISVIMVGTIQGWGWRNNLVYFCNSSKLTKSKLKYKSGQAQAVITFLISGFFLLILIWILLRCFLFFFITQQVIILQLCSVVFIIIATSFQMIVVILNCLY